MTKQDAINIIECKIEAENNNFEKCMKNNPNNMQRTHDHIIVLSVYADVIHDLNMLYPDE